jgi:hypothetical protein
MSAPRICKACGGPIQQPTGQSMCDDCEDCIVLVCPTCERVGLAAVNIPRVMDAAMHREIGEMISVHGYVSRHVPVHAVRKMQFRCSCPKT